MRDKCSVAFLRVSQLMLGIIDAIEDGDKEMLIKLSKHLHEDTSIFIGEAFILANITDEELDNLTRVEDDAELLKTAGSAYLIKTAKVDR